MNNKPLSIYFIYFWFFLFGLIPFGLILIVSFLSTDSTHLVALPWTIHQYQYLLTPTVTKIFLRSFSMALITTICCVTLAYPFSYLLVKSKHQSLLLLLIIIPFWTSSLVRTYALIAILKFNGILNAILLYLHIIHQPLTLLYTNFAVICGLVYNLFPFMVVPLVTSMERFDFQLIEAAADLGANFMHAFLRVFLPHTKRALMSGCLLVFLPAMTLFYIPNVLGGARSILLGNMIQNQFLVLENWPQGAATSIALTIMLIILIYALKRHD